jgi:hypothetical protein
LIFSLSVNEIFLSLKLKLNVKKLKKKKFKSKKLDLNKIFLFHQRRVVKNYIFLVVADLGI